MKALWRYADVPALMLPGLLFAGLFTYGCWVQFMTP